MYIYFLWIAFKFHYYNKIFNRHKKIRTKIENFGIFNVKFDTPSDRFKSREKEQKRLLAPLVSDEIQRFSS